MRGVRKKLEEEAQERWKENYFWHKWEMRAKGGRNYQTCIFVRVQKGVCVCERERAVWECLSVKMYTSALTVDWWKLLRAQFPATFQARWDKVWSLTYTKRLSAETRGTVVKDNTSSMWRRSLWILNAPSFFSSSLDVVSFLMRCVLCFPSSSNLLTYFQSS